MIKNVTAKGLKGLEINQDLSEKTILVGNNGSGKTAVSIAAQLAIHGYVPGTGKTNADILNAFGSGNKLDVGVQVNGTRLNRRWSRDSKGRVSQVYLVDTKKAGKDAYVAALAEAGNPKMFDLSAFMELSDQRKIDCIFDLFPPAADIGELDDEISALKDELNSNRSRIRDGEAFITKTVAARSEINLPAGTLAEVTGEIEKIEVEMAGARSSLEKAKEQKAKADAKAKAEAEAKAREEELKKQQEEDAKKREDEALQKGIAQGMAQQEQIKSEAAAVEKNRKDLQQSVDESNRRAQEQGFGSSTIQRDEDLPVLERTDLHQYEGFNGWQEAGRKSIQKIIDAIVSVDCPICTSGAAMMIARKELKRWTPQKDVEA